MTHSGVFRETAAGKGSHDPAPLFNINTTTSADSISAMISFLLRTAGPCLFIALQAACVAVALDILKMRSVKKLSCVPFASLLACGFYWSLYGWLKHDLTILVPNVISIGTGAFCMWAYYTNASLKPDLLYCSLGVFLALGACLGMLDMASSIGTIGCVMSVVMSGYPLAVIKTVIKEQTTASLPFSTSFVAWLNSCSWVAYGYFIAHDPMILMPNSLGLLLTTLQMSLFVVYGVTTAGQQATISDTAAGVDAELENPYNV